MEIKYLPYTEYIDEHTFWDALIWEHSSVLIDHEERWRKTHEMVCKA